MADNAIRPYGPAFLPAAAGTLFSVATINVNWYVLRNIRLANESSASVTVALSIGADGAGKRIIGPNFSLGPNAVYDWSGFMIILPGESVTGWAGAGNSVTCTISAIKT